MRLGEGQTLPAVDPAERGQQAPPPAGGGTRLQTEKWFCCPLVDRTDVQEKNRVEFPFCFFLFLESLVFFTRFTLKVILHMCMYNFNISVKLQLTYTGVNILKVHNLLSFAFSMHQSSYYDEDDEYVP